MSLASYPRALLSGEILSLLHSTLKDLHAQGLARDLDEVYIGGYHMGPHHWLRPDVSITHAGQPHDDHMLGAPALAVEVVAKRQTAWILRRKVEVYMENGGREAWLWYPRERVVVVHRGAISTQVQGKLTSELLPGVTIEIEELFKAD
jgi:Uma2 family endonuclease